MTELHQPMEQSSLSMPVLDRVHHFFRHALLWLPLLYGRRASRLLHWLQPTRNGLFINAPCFELRDHSHRTKDHSNSDIGYINVREISKQQTWKIRSKPLSSEHEVPVERVLEPSQKTILARTMTYLERLTIIIQHLKLLFPRLSFQEDKDYLFCWDQLTDPGFNDVNPGCHNG